VKLTLGGVLGFAVVAIVFLLLATWVASRRLLHSPYPSTPLSAAQSGWRAVFRLTQIAPLVALAGFAIKLSQSLGKDAANILLRHWPRTWSITGLIIEIAFTLAWAAFAMRIYLLVLAPDATAAEIRARTYRAVLYALIGRILLIGVTIAGIALVVAVRGADHGKVMRAVDYFSHGVTVVLALSRPAIATGLARPIRECLRILRENWFGAAVTLVLAALPLTLVFLGVALLLRFVHLPLPVALALEIPIAALSALCYAAFEGVIAAMYKRIM
jgi:magnesium-transporting ATPase (P-type)